VDIVIDNGIWNYIISKEFYNTRINMTYKKKKDILEIIIDIILILGTILLIYWWIELMFGGSPGLSEFNSLLIILMGGVLFKLYRESGILMNEMRHLSKGVKGGFDKIKEGFDKIKDDMSLIKEDMSLIKKKLKVK